MSQDPASNVLSLLVEPIGIIRTPFHDRYDAPRQPGSGNAQEGVIELLPGKNFEQALEDLDGFEKIWVIYWFDRNPNWKPKVLPPRDRSKRGVFATRSPHRPNPLGLSLLTLLSVQGLTIRVGEVDLLDRTPILDIKPYLPDVEAFPDARAGWLDALERRTGTVVWSERALTELAFLESCGVFLRDHVESVLHLDPFPHPYRRISEVEGGYELAVRSWRVRYTIDEGETRIDEIRSGYEATESEPENMHDASAHRAFWNFKQPK